MDDNRPNRDDLYQRIKQSCEDAESQGVRIFKRDIRAWVNDEGVHLSNAQRKDIVRQIWSMFGG